VAGDPKPADEGSAEALSATLVTCKNRLPYNLYCVGGDVKHCSIQSNSATLAEFGQSLGRK